MKVNRPPTQDETNTSTDSTKGSAKTTNATQDTEKERHAVTEFDKDAIFSLLKNHRRRIVLHYLAAHQGEVTIGTIAEYIAAIENDTTVRQLNSQQRKRVYVALYQCHLPMLDDYGVIDFNRPRGLLTLSPNARQLEPYLDDTVTETKSWSDYLTITVFGGLLYLFGGLLVGPGSWFTIVTVVGLLSSLTVLAVNDGRDEIIATVRASAQAAIPDSVQTVVRAGLEDGAATSEHTVADD